MRTIDEIKADIRKHEAMRQKPLFTDESSYLRAQLETDIRHLYVELNSAITNGIPLDRLEAMCAAERDGRCMVLPCKVGGTLRKDKDEE